MVASKANALAVELERANDEVAAFALACSPEQWRAVVRGEQWPVGVVVHHVAVGHDLMRRWLGRVAAGDDITTPRHRWTPPTRSTHGSSRR